MWVAGNQRHYEWMADVLRQIESIDTKEMVETHLFITQLFQNFDLRTTMLVSVARDTACGVWLRWERGVDENKICRRKAVAKVNGITAEK